MTLALLALALLTLALLALALLALALLALALLTLALLALALLALALLTLALLALALLTLALLTLALLTLALLALTLLTLTLLALALLALTLLAGALAHALVERFHPARQLARLVERGRRRIGLGAAERGRGVGDLLLHVADVVADFLLEVRGVAALHAGANHRPRIANLVAQPVLAHGRGRFGQLS